MFPDPSSILDQVKISQGLIVADIGAGSGAYTLLLSPLVGDRGRVYAIDIQKDVLTRISSDARSEGKNNIEFIWGDAEKSGGTKLRDALCDLVTVSNILFQIEDKDIFINEVKRILKPGGRVLVIDTKTSLGNKKLFQDKGFTLEKDLDAGAAHYGMILRKP